MEWLVLISIAWFLFCLGLYISRRHSQQSKNLNEHEAALAREMLVTPRQSCRSFLAHLFIVALFVRLVLVLLLYFTDAIRLLHLSPDSLRYHNEGIAIATEMQQGFFNWPNWIDNGWFQFTGFVYYMFGTHAILIQILNATLGALTPIIIYYLVKRAFSLEQTARWTAILIAFFPSFIYWSCLMLKDTLAIFAMSLLVMAVVSHRNRFEFRWLAVMVIPLLVFLGIRVYMFFVGLFFIALSYFPVEEKKTIPSLAKMMAIVLLVGTAAYTMGYGFFGMDFIHQSHYFDLDYINQSRVKIGDHGSGAFFDDPSSALWGKDLGGTLKALAGVVYFSLVSLDLTDLGSTRQLMALPEVTIFFLLLPNLFRGVAGSWRNLRQRTLPLMVFGFGILAVIGSAATNMGAMFRWRMQALPFLLAFLVYGLTLSGRGWLYRLLSRLRI